MSECDYHGCGGNAVKRGLCSAHYKMQRAGQPLRPLRKYVRGTIRERLTAWSHDDEFGCRIWDGHTYSNGYGRMRVDGVVRLVHRLSYEDAVGPIPDGLEIDHLCMNRLCILPAHLEPVTREVNLKRLGKTLPRDPATGRYMKRYTSPVSPSM